jgi:hypothetical protein
MGRALFFKQALIACVWPERAQVHALISDRNRQCRGFVGTLALGLGLLAASRGVGRTVRCKAHVTAHPPQSYVRAQL